MPNHAASPRPGAPDEIAGGYIVRDANGQALAYVYPRDNEDEARQAKVLTTSSGCRNCEDQSSLIPTPFQRNEKIAAVRPGARLAGTGGRGDRAGRQGDRADAANDLPHQGHVDRPHGIEGLLTGTVPRARIKKWLKAATEIRRMHAKVVPSHFLLSGSPAWPTHLRMRLLHWGSVGTEVRQSPWLSLNGRDRIANFGDTESPLGIHEDGAWGAARIIETPG
jgi:hypothetical protein